MSYTILYHPKVKEEDIESLDKKKRKIIAKAIEARLSNQPERYGKPLRGSLKGYWKLRVGDIRVVFKIMRNEVHILGIINRKLVYEKIAKRL
jgi:mRNA interferase RelE/StbE